MLCCLCLSYYFTAVIGHHDQGVLSIYRMKRLFEADSFKEFESVISKVGNIAVVRQAYH